MTEIPDFIHPYLWDTPIEGISITKHAKFIIERVLEYGNEEAIIWLNKTYTKNQVKEVLINSRRISPKTGVFYASMYEADPNELTCTKQPFTQKQNRF
jgi:hypothetical protein